MDENNKIDNKGLSEEYFQEENQTSTYTNNDTNNTDLLSLSLKYP